MKNHGGIFSHLSRSLLAIIFSVLAGCSGGGAGLGALIVALASSNAATTVPLVVFPGDEATKPAVLLPFTSEVQALAVSPDGRRLFTADSLHNTVSVIDTTSKAVITVLDVSTGPRFIAVTPDSSKALVTGYGNVDIISRDLPNNKVSIIDTASLQVSEITVGNRPHAIAFSSDSATAYVTNSGADSISIIDLNSDTLVTTLDNTSGFFGIEPVAIAITADDSRAFVVNRGSNDVITIDLQTTQVIHTEPVGFKPTGIVLSHDTVYVTNRDSNSVSYFDLDNSQTQTELTVGTGPMALVLSPDGNRVYVANAFGGQENDLCGLEGTPVINTLSVIDTTTKSVLPGEVTVGAAPIGVVITGDSNKLYAISACTDAASNGGILTKLTTSSITSNANVTADLIPVTARMTAMALAPDSSELYLAHPHAVSVFDVTQDSLVGSPVSVRGSGPTRMAITGDGTRLYGIHPGLDAVSVIDLDPNNLTERFLGMLSVGSRPSSLAITHDDSKVYVTNAGFSRTPSSDVSVIDVAPPGQLGNVSATLSLDDGNLGRGPVDIVITPDDSQALVANFGDFFPNSREPGIFLSSIDLNNNNLVSNHSNTSEWLVDVALDPGFTVIPPATAPPAPPQITSDANENLVYLLDFKNDDLYTGTASDPNGVFDISSSALAPGGIALANHLAYVANYRAANDSGGQPVTSVTEFSLNLQGTTLEVAGGNAGRIISTPDESTLYLLHSGDRAYLCDDPAKAFCDIDNRLSVIELPFSAANTLTLTVGQRPDDIAFTPDRVNVPKRAFVSNYFDGTVSVIEPWALDATSTPAVVDTLTVGTGPMGIIVNPGGTRAYVANSISNTISVIAIDPGMPSSVIDTITLAP